MNGQKEVLSEVANSLENPELSPLILNAGCCLIKDHRRALKYLDAWKAGEIANVAYPTLVYSLGFSILAEQKIDEDTFVGEGALPKEILLEVQAIEEGWESIKNEYAAEYIKTDPRFEYTEDKGDPIEYRLSLFNSSETSENQRQAMYDSSDYSNKQALQDERALPLLEKQSALEEKALDILAPHWREAIEHDFEEELVSFHPQTEPKDINQAIQIIENCNLHTKGTLEYCQLPENSGGMTGGYGTMYALMKQDGFFTSLFTPWQLLEAKNFIETWRAWDNSVFLNITREYFEDPTIEDAYEALKDLPPKTQDALSTNACHATYKSPEGIEHFGKQSKFEKELVKRLEDNSGQSETPSASELAQVCHACTEESIKTFQRKDLYGFRGGFGLLYQTLEQNPELAAYLGEDLVKEGLEFYRKWGAFKTNALRDAIRKVWGIDIGKMDPETFLDKLENSEYGSHSIQPLRNTREASVFLFINNPEVLDLLQKQAAWEEKLLAAF